MCVVQKQLTSFGLDFCCVVNGPSSENDHANPYVVVKFHHYPPFPWQELPLLTREYVVYLPSPHLNDAEAMLNNLIIKLQ